jgi:hypothetical protein
MHDLYHPDRDSYLDASEAERQQLQARWAEEAVVFGGRYPAERACMVCGVVFRYPHASVRLCSRTCALARATALRRASRQYTTPRVHLYAKRCVQCGQPFTASRRDATTCSTRCRTAHFRAARRT